MTTRLTDRVIVVTSCGSGSGRALALRLAREGAIVHGADPDADAAATTRRQSRGLDHQIATRAPLQVPDDRELGEWISEIGETYGRIDAVCTVITSPRASADTNGVDLWSNILVDGLGGAHRAVRHAWPYLARSRHPAVVLVGPASAVAHRDEGIRAALESARGGVVHLTKHLAAHGAPDGIRVNCLSPGVIFTDDAAEDLLAPRNGLDELHRSIALGRVGEPQDVAACAAFLVSDDAAYVTGTELVVDGGWSTVSREAPMPTR